MSKSRIAEIVGNQKETNGVPEQRSVTIKPVNFQTASWDIVGIDPMVVHRFGQKAKDSMMEIVSRSEQDIKSKRRARKPRDFNADFTSSRHISTDGWDGFSALSVKAGMVNICVIKDYYKTRAKMVLFVEPDGFSEEGTPLIKITKGAPRPFTACARNKGGGTDIRTRAWFDSGWEATVRITFDADVFTLTDVTNLLNAAGQQCGTGEGRPASTNSAGCGWGRYKIKGV